MIGRECFATSGPYIVVCIFEGGGLFDSLPIYGQGSSSCPVRASMAQGQINRSLAL
jgi:hypothetical protein